MSQLSLLNKTQKRELNRVAHGGDKANGKRKTARPFATNKWVHLVLKLEKHRLNFYQRDFRIKVPSIVQTIASQLGVTIADLVLMRDHIHIKIKSGSRVCFQRFLRTVTGVIARTMTGARRGMPFGSFWRGLAYTRVLKSAKEVLYLRGYFTANRIEYTHGYQVREIYLDQYHEWVSSIAKSNCQADILGEAPKMCN